MEKRIFAMNAALAAAVIGLAVAGVGIPRSFAAGHGPGGNSAMHLSTRGISNSNGPNALDRDKGMARAQDRRGEHGHAGRHEMKGHAHAKRHGHGSGHGR